MSWNMANWYIDVFYWYVLSNKRWHKSDFKEVAGSIYVHGSIFVQTAARFYISKSKFTMKLTIYYESLYNLSAVAVCHRLHSLSTSCTE